MNIFYKRLFLLTEKHSYTKKQKSRHRIEILITKVKKEL
jgi:hypothetical protein